MKGRKYRDECGITRELVLNAQTFAECCETSIYQRTSENVLQKFHYRFYVYGPFQGFFFFPLRLIDLIVCVHDLKVPDCHFKT